MNEFIIKNTFLIWLITVITSIILFFLIKISIWILRNKNHRWNEKHINSCFIDNLYKIKRRHILMSKRNVEPLDQLMKPLSISLQEKDALVKEAEKLNYEIKRPEEKPKEAKKDEIEDIIKLALKMTMRPKDEN